MTEKPKKRAERSFSGSPTDSASDAKKAKMADVEQNELAQDDSNLSAKVLDATQALGKRLETRMKGIQAEMDVFRHELNQNLKAVKVTVKSIEKSLEELWNRVEESSKDLNDQKAVSNSIILRRTERQKGAVYKIKCCDCQVTYIGEIGRNLNLRQTEHNRATRNGDTNNHIAEHHLKTNHSIDWDSAECVTISTDYYKRIWKAGLLT